jgi:hypothetical protein
MGRGTTKGAGGGSAGAAAFFKHLRDVSIEDVKGGYNLSGFDFLMRRAFPKRSSHQKKL